MQQNTCCLNNLTQQPPSIFHRQAWHKLELEDYLIFFFLRTPRGQCPQSFIVSELLFASRTTFSEYCITRERRAESLEHEAFLYCKCTSHLEQHRWMHGVCAQCCKRQGLNFKICRSLLLLQSPCWGLRAPEKGFAVTCRHGPSGATLPPPAASAWPVCRAAAACPRTAGLTGQLSPVEPLRRWFSPGCPFLGGTRHPAARARPSGTLGRTTAQQNRAYTFVLTRTLCGPARFNALRTASAPGRPRRRRRQPRGSPPAPLTARPRVPTPQHASLRLARARGVSLRRERVRAPPAPADGRQPHKMAHRWLGLCSPFLSPASPPLPCV